MSPVPGTPMWTPTAEQLSESAIARFARAAGQGPEYQDLWRWSVRDLEGFWTIAADFLGVRWAERPAQVLGSRAMPGARWFPGGRLSFAEHVFAGRDPGKVAVRHASESRPGGAWTWADLYRETGRVQAGLRRLGVRPGDRVAAYLPNAPETLAAFLATTALGAVWTAAAPEFGAEAVIARFAQTEPVVLLAADGYRHKGNVIDRDARSRRIAHRVGAAHVRLGYLDGTGWDPEFIGPDDAVPEFETVPFDHPLWVLYSSGTTGPPKAIVHGQGGVLLELLKTMVLQLGVRPHDRVFWYTTTGWVMWNILAGALLADASVVLYDGHPGGEVLWDLAESTGITIFGTSPAYLDACMRSGIRPPEGRDLSALRAIGSTGSPLAPESYDWVYETFPSSTWLFSMSGGTDIVTPFLGPAPTVPVYRGEIGPPALGVDLRSYAEDGTARTGEVGELVVAQPMPSMPIAFWDDPSGRRLRDSYFTRFPGVWTHGDWLRLTERNTGIISGRSDATINRGGVRIGTAEIYQALRPLGQIADSMAIDLPHTGTSGVILLFAVLADGTRLDDSLRTRIATAIRDGCSPRHVPDDIIAVADLPRTSSGKKLELPTKRILMGAAAESVTGHDGLVNPAALEALTGAVRARGWGTPGDPADLKRSDFDQRTVS
ncbi:acetoacetate--CoA ligase [Actinomadura sp. B10D3]|uniref:acetoacetate--CoA ligase n=1 Tax=Actinomadura sp. B10D3 TaxID=3153557 RepID=UPI00325E9AD8